MAPSTQHLRQPNPYQWLGITLLATPFLFGFVLFAMAATMVEEQAMEDSVWGTVLLFLPNVVGALLLLFGRHVPPPIATVITQQVLVIAAGVASLLFGVVALTQGRDGDPNIGGSLLILVGLALCVGGSVLWVIAKRRRPPPPATAAPPAPNPNPIQPEH